MKHLNNKGYMLVEIILAFAIAMSVMYFMMELTVKLKNKNDDLVVKTLVATDQAIVYNAIMKDLYAASMDPTVVVNCGYVEGHFVDKDISDRVFEYNGFKNIISEYATVGALVCNDISLATGDAVYVKIPITVRQLPYENFDVTITFDV